MSHQDSHQPLEIGAPNSHAPPIRAHHQQQQKQQQQQQQKGGGGGGRAPGAHQDERQKGQPPTNHDSYGAPSTQGLVDAVMQEMKMWRIRVFAEEQVRRASW